MFHPYEPVDKLIVALHDQEATEKLAIIVTLPNGQTTEFPVDEYYPSCGSPLKMHPRTDTVVREDVDELEMLIGDHDEEQCILDIAFMDRTIYSGPPYDFGSIHGNPLMFRPNPSSTRIQVRDGQKLYVSGTMYSVFNRSLSRVFIFKFFDLRTGELERAVIQRGVSWGDEYNIEELHPAKGASGEFDSRNTHFTKNDSRGGSIGISYVYTLGQSQEEMAFYQRSATNQLFGLGTTEICQG